HLLARGGIWIARHHVRYQRDAPRGLRAGEGGGNGLRGMVGRLVRHAYPRVLFAHLAAHRVTPSAEATVLMSLSPRPERQSTTTPSGRSSPRSPSASRCATACADSSAGMMPSSWLSTWNAASASSSVAQT